jgi:hypothetical protein
MKSLHSYIGNDLGVFSDASVSQGTSINTDNTVLNIFELINAKNIHRSIYMCGSVWPLGRLPRLCFAAKIGSWNMFFFAALSGFLVSAPAPNSPRVHVHSATTETQHGQVLIWISLKVSYKNPDNSFQLAGFVSLDRKVFWMKESFLDKMVICQTSSLQSLASSKDSIISTHIYKLCSKGKHNSLNKHI